MGARVSLPLAKKSQTQRSRTTVKTDKMQDAGYLQDSQSFCQVHTHEGVAGKQSELHHFLAVSPLMNSAINRREALDATICQLPGYPFFVSGAGVEGVPIQDRW